MLAAMSRAVEALGSTRHGCSSAVGWPTRSGSVLCKAIIDSDAKCRDRRSVEIIAKVARDRVVADYAADVPGYGWELGRAATERGAWRALHTLDDTPPAGAPSTGACCRLTGATGGAGYWSHSVGRFL